MSEVTTEKGNWVGGLGNLGLLRQAGIMVGLAASVAVGFGVVLWSQEPDYRVLFSNIDFADANNVIEELQSNGIDYKFDATGRTILVPDRDLHSARLKLAADGISMDKNTGFEMLNGDQPLGSSQFMEVARYRHALENELAKTITSMNSVRSARVHLAIPKESTFIRDQSKPRASVFLDLSTGKTLEASQARAISNLISNSVPSLSSEDITIIDQQGRLLSAKSIDPEVEMASKQLEYTAKIEERLINSVNSIVSPIVGMNNFRAEVSADIDFTQVESATEDYASEPPVLRSEQVLNENRNTTVNGGVPGAISNIPPGTAEAPELVDGEVARTLKEGNGASKSQSVRNYEVDRQVSYTKHQTGKIERISVAVVLNNLSVAKEDGTIEPKEWSADQIKNIENLVKNAVGFNEARGDSVTVINSSFFREEMVEPQDVPIWEQNWFWNIIKQVFAGILVLVLVFGVLRPILKSLALQNVKDKEKSAASLDGLSLDAGKAVHSYEEQIEILRAMVAEDPAKVAQTVRQWVKDND